MKENQPPADPSSREMAAPISFAEACSIVAEKSAKILSATAFEAERCDLLHALGRVLAEPVLADRDQPPFRRVTRDGFAVRSEDVARAIPLSVVGQLRAGEPWPTGNPPLASGEAVEIMTGAPLPPGADAVLMVEHAQESHHLSPVDGGTEANPPRYVTPQSGQTLAAGENVSPGAAKLAKVSDCCNPAPALARSKSPWPSLAVSFSPRLSAAESRNRLYWRRTGRAIFTVAGCG